MGKRPEGVTIERHGENVHVVTIDGLMSTADFGGSGAWQDDEDDDGKVPVVARCVGRSAQVPTLRA